jgi:hypothetical protein
MSKKFVTGSGDKVKVFVALLPLGSREEPTQINGIVTQNTGIAANATVVNLSAAVGGQGIAAGTPLTFTNNAGASRKVYLTADAKADDTTLEIEPMVGGAISGVCTATYVPKLRLLGGTQSGATIGAQRTQTLVFEDPLGYEDGVVTSQNFEIPWTANLLADDDAYRRVFYAASNAIEGREVYVWQYDPPPAGYTVGDGLKGACVITNFQKSFQAGQILTFQCTFNGQGSPELLRYA